MMDILGIFLSNRGKNYFYAFKIIFKHRFNLVFESDRRVLFGYWEVTKDPIQYLSPSGALY